jgi:hypothetical protein
MYFCHASVKSGTKLADDMTIVIIDALYNLPKRAWGPALLTLRQAASSVKNKHEEDGFRHVRVRSQSSIKAPQITLL